MEGINIINRLISDSKIDDKFLLTAKNYISPVLHVTSKKSLNDTSQNAYYEFSAKLVRSCVGVIEKRSLVEVKVASDIACLGLTAIEVLLNFNSKVDIEKVLHAVLHCFLHLSKRNLSDEFLLFSKRFVSLCDCYVEFYPTNNSRINTIAEKAYQFHWRISTTIHKSSGNECNTTVLLLQLQSILVYLYCESHIHDAMDSFYITLMSINDTTNTLDSSIANVIDSILCRLEAIYPLIKESEELCRFHTMLLEIMNLLRKLTIMDFDLKVSVSKCPGLGRYLENALLLINCFKSMKKYVLLKNNFLSGESLESFTSYKKLLQKFISGNTDDLNCGCTVYLFDGIGDVFGKYFLHCYGCIVTLLDYLYSTNEIIAHYLQYIMESGNKNGTCEKRKQNHKIRIEGIIDQRNSVVALLMSSYQNILSHSSKQSSCKKCKKTTDVSIVLDKLEKLLKTFLLVLSSVSPDKVNYIRCMINNATATVYKKGDFEGAAKLADLGIEYGLAYNEANENKINLTVNYRLLIDCCIRTQHFEKALDASASNVSQSIAYGLSFEVIEPQIDSWCTIKKKMAMAMKKSSSKRTLFSSVEVKDDHILCLLLQAELEGYKSLSINGAFDVEIEAVCQSLISTHAQNDNTCGLVLGMIEIASLPGNVEDREQVFLKIFKLIKKKVKSMKLSESSIDLTVFDDIKALTHFKYGMMMYHSACKLSDSGDPCPPKKSAHARSDMLHRNSPALVLLEDTRKARINSPAARIFILLHSCLPTALEQRNRDEARQTVHEPLNTEADFNLEFNYALNIWWELYKNDKFDPNDSVCRKSVQDSLFTLSQLMILFDKEVAAIKSIWLHQHVSVIKKPPEIPEKLTSSLCSALNISSNLMMGFESKMVAEKLEKMKNYNLTEYERNEISITLAYFQNQLGETSLAKELIDNAVRDITQERHTKSSMFLQGWALLVKYKVEHYQCIAKGEQVENPCQTLKRALRFFETLMTSVFQAEQQTDSIYTHSVLKENTMFENDDGRLSISILNRFLDCLLLLSRECEHQGLVTESRFNLEQGIIVCKQFKLYDRLALFMVEKVEILKYSNSDKLPESIEEVKVQRFFTESINLEEVPSCHIDDDYKSVDFCLSAFKYYVMANSSKKSNSLLTLLDTISKFSSSLHKNVEEVYQEIKNSFIILPESGKKVQFTDAKLLKKKKKPAKEKIPQETNKDNIDDLIDMLTFDTVIQLSKLLSRLPSTSGLESITITSIIKNHIETIKHSHYYHEFKHHYRKALLMLYTWLTITFASSEQCTNAINLQWNILKSSEADFVEKEQVVTVSTKKAASRKGKKKTNNESDESEEVCCKDVITDTDKAKKTTCRGKANARKTRAKKTKAADPCLIDSDVTCHPGDKNDASSLHLAQQYFTEACSYLTCYDYLERKELSQFGVLLNGCKNPTLTTTHITHHFLQSNSHKLLETYGKQMSDDTEQKKAHQKLLDVSNSTLTSNCDEIYQHLLQLINEVCPQDWRICYMFLSTIGPKRLVFARLQANKDPIIVSQIIDDNDDASSDEDSDSDGVICDLASIFTDNPLEELNGILQKSNDTMSIQSPQDWWSSRKALDKKMMKLLAKLEKKWLSCWKGILMGELQDKENHSAMKTAAESLQQIFTDNLQMDITLDLALVLLETLIIEQSNQISIIIKSAFGDIDPKVLRNIVRLIKNLLLKSCKSLFDLNRGPVILVLDEQLSSVPWETLGYLSDVPITRMPSLLHLLAQLRIRKDVLTNGVDPTSSFFVLNPGNDLPRTEKTFYKLFTEQRRWPGIAGRPPTAEEYKKALTDYELYIYCGHGSGREYLRTKLVQQLDCKAVSLLMGCSSGKLKKNGLYDATGMVMNYLYSSCPAAVANLWDVTDKDIDRFLQQLLKEWLDENGNSTIASCVTNARKACRLGFLVGGSPVVYGLPVRLKDISQ